MKRFLSILITLSLVACQPDPTMWATINYTNTQIAHHTPEPPQSVTPSQPIQTPTAAPENTPEPVVPSRGGGSGDVPIISPEQNYLPDQGSDPDILSRYYAPSPAVLYGYVTRYVDTDRAVSIGLWQLGHFREQVKAGYPMLGGNYRHGLASDSDYAKWIVDHIPPIMELTPPQLRLYRLSVLSDEAAAVVLRSYDAVIALKSPNDIGRVYCVYLPAGALVGRVIVMDTSSVNDYTGIGGTQGIPLGRRVTTDGVRQRVHWAADVPDTLWRKLVAGDNAWAVFDEDTGDRGCPATLQADGVIPPDGGKNETGN